MIQTQRNISAAQLLKVSEILKAIGHPVRLEIMELLEVKEPLTVTELQASLSAPIEQSMLSHHLIKMKDKGILRCEKRGLHVHYSLVDRKLLKIFDCMENCSIF
jgi:DNA-binding transcriptional ArsR family regulator